NKILLFVNVVIVIVIVIVIAAIATNAWTNPTANPPGGGGTLYYYNGNVGVGTAIPTAALTLGADKSFRLIGGTSFPGSPQEGEIFFRTDNKQLYTYANSAWQGDRTIAGKIVAASNSLNKEKADYVCDGTDDQVEIQAAIDALGANGGAVYLLEGTFNISASINLDNVAPDDSGKAIIGAGTGTVLKVTTGASNVNVVNASSVNNILISQLMIDGNNKTGSNNQGIEFNSVTYSKIDKVWVKEAVGKKTAGCGIYLYASSNNTISGTDVQGNRTVGIKLSSSNNNTIAANTVQGNGAGIELSSSNNNTITTNTVADTSLRSSLEISSSNNNTINNNIFTPNAVGGGSIEFSNSSYNIYTGNILQGSGLNGINIRGSHYNIITANTVSGSAGFGIAFYNSNNSNTISGNIIYENGVSMGGVGTGIYIDGNSDNNLISSNRIYDSVIAAKCCYGIDITNSTGDNNYLVGNLIDGDGFIAPIQDLGANTKYTDKTKMTLEQAAVLTINNGSTITPSSPTSYQLVKGNGAVTANATTPIAQGKAAGDILILQGDPGIAANTVTIPNSGNVKLGASRVLAANDTLSLFWSGTYWVETGYSDN
ncbi:MAG: NosD domain-containing protein, partial [bacterium]|nr:NosD domain-containing protein [bacterium]